MRAAPNPVRVVHRTRVPGCRVSAIGSVESVVVREWADPLGGAQSTPASHENGTGAALSKNTTPSGPAEAANARRGSSSAGPAGALGVPSGPIMLRTGAPAQPASPQD